MIADFYAISTMANRVHSLHFCIRERSTAARKKNRGPEVTFNVEIINKTPRAKWE